MTYYVMRENAKQGATNCDDELIKATARKILLASFTFAVLVVVGVIMLSHEPRSSWLQSVAGIWTLIRYVGAAGCFALAALSLLHHVYMCLPALHRAEAAQAERQS